MRSDEIHVLKLTCPLKRGYGPLQSREFSQKKGISIMTNFWVFPNEGNLKESVIY